MQNFDPGAFHEPHFKEAPFQFEHGEAAVFELLIEAQSKDDAPKSASLVAQRDDI